MASIFHFKQFSASHLLVSIIKDDPPVVSSSGHRGLFTVRIERSLQDSAFQSVSEPTHLEPPAKLIFALTEPPTPQLPHCSLDAAGII